MGMNKVVFWVLCFSKMYGVGNDFIVLDLCDGSLLLDLVLVVCLVDCYIGVGCDQILIIELFRVDGLVVLYWIWNVDGFSLQQCGNGVCCVVVWLVCDGVVSGDVFVIDSLVIIYVVECLGEYEYVVVMGVLCFEFDQVLLIGFVYVCEEYLLLLQGDIVCFGVVLMGNLYVVIEVGLVDVVLVECFGLLLQQYVIFLQLVNVGFVQVMDLCYVCLCVYECGVGEILVCGSGVCVVVVVMMYCGWLECDVIMLLFGGDLCICWLDLIVQIVMFGLVVFVFEGEWNV